MFDGWEDINGNSVVNVMLRVTTTNMTGTTTFFLDSVYTKEKKINTEKYVQVIQEVMESFRGNRKDAFLGINGAVSDSARACVKAKNILAANHAGMVQLQDQAHATDLLLSDLGKLPWIGDVLEKVNFVVQATRNNRKLLSRFRDLIHEYNREVKMVNARLKAARSEGLDKEDKGQVEDLWSMMDVFELDELDKSLTSARGVANTESPREAKTGKGRAPQERTELPTAHRTAVTLKKTVKTRFASCETMLEIYVRSRTVLQRLIRDPEFDRLYDTSRVANREKRDQLFVQVIDDDSFYNDVKDLHSILQVIRRYLRIWDAENAQISEVVPATIMLESALNRVEQTPFFTKHRKREVLRALERRCKGRTAEDGGSMQIRILQDVHYAAWILDPNMCPLDIARHLPALERHMVVYLAGAKDGMSDQDRVQLAKAMIKKYKEVHRLWDTIKKGTTNSKIIESFAGYAVRYWEDESPAKQVSERDDDPVAIDLQYFARNTLSLCPSSCATERSFSHQGRIHTKQRNRLAPEVVRNLLFCKWNSIVLRQLDRLEFDKSRDAEDFFNKPTFSSVFNESERKEVLHQILYKERIIHREIFEARGELYHNSDVYKFSGTIGDSYVSTMPSGPSLSYTTSAHDRSTTLLGEVFGIPASISLRERPRQFRASTREELTQLLSGSKEPAARRRRLDDAVRDHRVARERLEAPNFDVDTVNTDIQPSGVATQGSEGNGNDLRDEDDILMSVSTIRQLLRDKQAPQSGSEVQGAIPRFSSAQETGYFQAPVNVPPTPAQPTYRPSYLVTQWPYNAPHPTPHPTYSPPYPTAQSQYPSSHPPAFPQPSAVIPTTGLATNYADYGRSQRAGPQNWPTQYVRQSFRGSTTSRGRGRAAMAYQRMDYSQPAQIDRPQQPDQVLEDYEEEEQDGDFD